MNIRLQDLARFTAERFIANHQIVWMIGDEAYSYENEIQASLKLMKDERNVTVRMVKHDKLCGFYEGTPPMRPPTNKSNVPLNALAMIIGDDKTMQATCPSAFESGSGGIPFNAVEDIIFVLRDWEQALLEQPLVVQYLRNVVQANMCSNAYYYNEVTGQTTRGKRMIVLLTPTDRRPPDFPEIKPIFISLPDASILAKAVDNVVDPLLEDHKESKGKKGIKECPKETRTLLTNALRGTTYQFAEDTISFAIARHRNFEDIDACLKTIEGEKSVYVAGIPGLTYISKENLTPVSELPGWEPAIEFIRDCMAISHEEAKKRKMQRLRGITLAGAPGTGKTQFGMAVAQETDSLLLLWSPGESQGSLVGESEKYTRQVIQVANAMQATVLVDDLDKAGVSIASGAHTSSVEGGPFGRMIQMLLTTMSSKENEAIWVFTMNRITGVPPELIRPGRMDERFFISRPDAITRERILKVHILSRCFDLDNTDESMIRQIADDEFTEGWTGAELEDLVKRGIRRTLRNGEKRIDFKWLTQQARNITPMIRQEAYADDIKKMEDFCKTWTKCGLSTGEPVADDRKTRSRAARSVG